MKLFHISDVLSITTGRLVSSRHIGGVYDILNFLTGDNVFTHQIPRAMSECQPWLRSQFPRLFIEEPVTERAIAEMDGLMVDGDTGEQRAVKIGKWVERLRRNLDLPAMLPVYEMGADMHLRIDPIEEARAMMGDDRVLVVNPSDDPNAGC